MQRMTHTKTNLLSAIRVTQGRLVRCLMTAVTAFTFFVVNVSQADAQVVHADADYAASGFVTPAGMVPPELNGGIMQAGYYPGGASGSSSCDSGGCDSMYGDGGGAGGVFGGSGGGAACGSGGVFGKLQDSALRCGGCGIGGCGFCGGLSNLRHMCVFCRGQGCGVCQLKKTGGICGAIGGGAMSLMSALRPYSKAGLCSQRWYDLSAEAIFLGHTTGGIGGVTSDGIGGPIVLSTGDANAGDLESGVRLSGAVMFGPGANIEATWIGGHDWSGNARVSDPGAGLFSFISDFGRDTNLNGFDDIDRSLSQSVEKRSEFDSIELNYRRRIVGPFCRFQGSWLAGLRYIQYSDGLTYRTNGVPDNRLAGTFPRFFNSIDDVENSMFGGQVGGDVFWNINPGVSLGIGTKLLWLKNDIDRNSRIEANSIVLPGATAGAASLGGRDETGTFGGEFEMKLIYRLSHSWSFRTSYYALALDDVAFGTADRESIAEVVTRIRDSVPPPTRNENFDFGSLVVQGFSVGAEYAW